LQQLRFDPEDPDRILAQATWGLARSDDGGSSWRWTCAAVYGVDARMEDPAASWGPDGEILLATFRGVWSSVDGCAWEQALADEFASDVVVVEGVAMAAATRGAAEDQLFRREDDAWVPFGETTGRALVDHVLAAGERLYLVGAVPRTAETERALTVLRSDDGGRTHERFEVPIEEEDRGLVAWTLGDDPDELWVSVWHARGETTPERVMRSRDGGESWDEVLRVAQVGGVAVDGERAWIGSKLGGLWRSDGDGFTRISEVAVRCLEWVNDALWICGDEALGGVALSRSVDGDELEPVVRLREIAALEECARCSDVGVTCPGWLPDIVVDLGIDPETVGIPPPELDGSVGAPRDASLPFECGGPPPSRDGCACRASGPEETPVLVLLLLVFGARLRRAARRRHATPR